MLNIYTGYTAQIVKRTNLMDLLFTLCMLLYTNLFHSFLFVFIGTCVSGSSSAAGINICNHSEMVLNLFLVLCSSTIDCSNPIKTKSNCIYKIEILDRFENIFKLSTEIVTAFCKSP